MKWTMDHLLAGNTKRLQLKAMQATLEQQLTTVAQSQLLLLLLLAGTSQLQNITHTMVTRAALSLMRLLAQRAEIQCTGDAVVRGLHDER